MKILPKRKDLAQGYPVLLTTTPRQSPPRPRSPQDLIYLATTKCGSTTVRSAIGQWRTTKTALTLDEAAEYETRFTTIRHPVARLRSAWAHQWSEHRWEDFVAHVLPDPDWDVYTAPYADKEARVANIILNLEAFPQAWAQLRMLHPELPGITQSFNVRGRATAVDVPLANEITAVYAADLAIWNAVQRGGGILFK